MSGGCGGTSVASARAGERVRRALLAVVVLGLVATGLVPGVAGAAGQPEASAAGDPAVGGGDPAVGGGDPAVDGADVYAFVSPDRPGTVTLIADWLPFEKPAAGSSLPVFRPGAHYDINVDSDGDARPDVTYRWVFGDAAADSGPADGGPADSRDDPAPPVRQTYTLTEIRDGRSTTLLRDAVAAPPDAGPSSIPDYAMLRGQAIRALAGGGQAFAGQADDPSFLDRRVFDLLYGDRNNRDRHHSDPHHSDPHYNSRDTLAGYNVLATALQVPASDLAENGDAGKNPVIGVWSAASTQDAQPGPAKTGGTASAGGTAKAGGTGSAGGTAQVSRVGNPLVDDIVAGSGATGAFAASSPDRDTQDKAFIAGITDPELPRLFQSTYRIPAPPAPRNDLVEIFLTGVAKDAPTLDGTAAPIRTDLNSQILNQEAQHSAFVPAEELRLNLSVPVTAHPKRLGVLAGDDQGFPNGRRLTDDVVDIELQLLEGATRTGTLPGTLVPRLADGDEVNANDVPFGDTFPYLALPHRPAG